jgi:hypothetical protein
MPNYVGTTKLKKLPLNIPNGRKSRPDVDKIDQCHPLRDPPKFTQIGDFWFEKIPSGNPDCHRLAKQAHGGQGDQIRPMGVCFIDI